MKQRQAKEKGKFRGFFRSISAKYKLFVERRRGRKIRKLVGTLMDDDSILREKPAGTLVTIGKPAFPYLIELSKDKKFEMRTGAVSALAIMGEPAVPYLVKALKDENKDVRKGAARALEVIKDIRAVEPLIELLKDEKWEVREAAAEALEKIIGKIYRKGIDRVLEELTKALQSDWMFKLAVHNVQLYNEVFGKPASDENKVKLIIGNLVKLLRSNEIFELAINNVQLYNEIFERAHRLMKACEERLEELGEQSETETG